MRVAALSITVIVAASAARADDVDDLRKKYLSDSATSTEIKHAIEQRIVIPGMCPFQAFAAAGEPGFSKVVADKKWPGNIPPPVIINAQCDHPDDSLIELTFRSSTQFHTKEPVPFTVKFEHGRSVSIDQVLPSTIARPRPPNSDDYPENSPIHRAAKTGSLDAARALIQADPALVNARNAFGVTPLYLAAGANQPAVAKLLIEAGADINAKSSVGQSPLAAASALGHAEIVKLLLANGANVNDHSKFTPTPLQAAAANGHKDVVEVLLAHGADVAAKDIRGRTALQWARGARHQEVVEILLAHGASGER
jgi:Ankyrin repeats (3 copies)